MPSNNLSQRKLASAATLMTIACNIGASLAFLQRANVPLSRPSFVDTPLAFTPSSASSEPSGADGLSQTAKERVLREFINLEPIPESRERTLRQQKDDRVRSQFVSFGNDLWDLRSKLNSLTLRLIEAMTESEEHCESMREEELRQQLLRVERKDAELVYMLELADAHEAYGEDRREDAAIHMTKAREARSCLPQFNLEGLWFGEYLDHGVQVINVTYVGDTLVATKVTGDIRVPRGEVTFQADLHPVRLLDDDEDNEDAGEEEDPRMEPIVLGDQAAEKWGTRELPRYKGQGQVAEPGFQNEKWMDGQLVIVGQDKFGFVWTELGQQVFFARPSDIDVLQLLQEANAPPSSSDRFELQLDHVAKCMVHTQHVQDDQKEEDGVVNGMDGYGCIFLDNQEDSSNDELYFA